MTENTTLIDQAPFLASPFDILLRLVVTLLIPSFLPATGGDMDLARLAAREAVNAHRPRDQADLIVISRIIACGLASLQSIGRSMEDGLPLSMVLRLRGSSVALSRTADQGLRALQKPRPKAVPAPLAPLETGKGLPPAGMAAGDAGQHSPVPAAIPVPASVPANERKPQAAETTAITGWPGDNIASLPFLPPPARKSLTIRAATLGSVASSLLAGDDRTLHQDSEFAGLPRSKWPVSHETGRPQPRA